VTLVGGREVSHGMIEGLSSLIPVYGILHIVNGFLLGDAYLLVVL
jgi:hypothetical protein